MSGFGITPTGSGVPATDQGFPNFIQWQSNGMNLGGPDADTVNIGAGITVTRGVGEQENVITLTAEAPPELVWRHIDGDGVVEFGDVANGISMDGDSASALVIPPGLILPGRSVLVLQRGAGQVSFPAQSGLDFVYRTGTFDASIAGQGGIITLIGLDDGSVLLCGDLTVQP